SRPPPSKHRGLFRLPGWNRRVVSPGSAWLDSQQRVTTYNRGVPGAPSSLHCPSARRVTVFGLGDGGMERSLHLRARSVLVVVRRVPEIVLGKDLLLVPASWSKNNDPTPV